MRIFMFILSLIIAVACVFLNILNFNGTLSQTEFLLINIVAEILLCLILGHFMYRTYANYKRAKSLSQELTNAQAALQLKTKEAASAREAAAAAATHESATVEESSVAEPAAPASAATMQQAAVSAETTQPLPEIHTATDDLETTTLFKGPLVK